MRVASGGGEIYSILDLHDLSIIFPFGSDDNINNTSPGGDLESHLDIQTL